MKKRLQFTLLIIAVATGITSAQKFVWSNTGGGAAGYEDAFGIATDSVGNSVFVGPYTTSAVFGTTNLTAVSTSQDIYISKINASGVYQWTVSAGGKGGDGANDVTMDAAGNVYVVGGIGDTAMFGSVKVNPPGGFVAKYNSAGVCQWAKAVAGSYIHKVAIDKAGNVYVTGTYNNSVKFGSTTLTSAGAGDIFVAKYDNSGSVLWAISMGGPNDEIQGPGSIVADKAGNVYVTGTFTTTMTVGTKVLTSSGGANLGLFVAKFTTAGNYVWAVQATGTSNDYWANDICLSPKGDAVYMYGSFNGSITLGTTTLGPAANYNPVLAKLDTAGNFTWAISAQSTTFGKGSGVTTDTSGKVIVTGWLSPGTVNFGSYPVTSAYQDSYIARASSAGVWQWAKITGVNVFTYNDGGAVATDHQGKIYHAARYMGTISLDGHPQTSSASGNSWDAYVCMLDPTLVTGINEQTSFGQVSIYPNPVSGNLNISISSDESKEVLVNIVDIAGQLIHSEKLAAGSGQTIATVNTSSFAKGMYFVQLVSGNESTTKKIIVE